jgi:hypothetical protein
VCRLRLHLRTVRSSWFGWRQSGLAAAEGGVILLIGRVPSHLGHRAAGAPERLAAILAPAAASLGDAVLRADAAGRPRHNNYFEDGKRDVQAHNHVRQNRPVLSLGRY